MLSVVFVIARSSVVILFEIRRIVVILNVVMLSVVAPFYHFSFHLLKEGKAEEDLKPLPIYSKFYFISL